MTTRMAPDALSAATRDASPASTGLERVGMARFDRDVLASLPAGTGDREQTERAATDDRDTFARRGIAEAQRVPRDGSRLDDRRVAQIEAIGDRDESRGRGA